ncbi:hypothetical protein HFP72_04110 [Nocardiopsis sp. ARC36]
MSKPRWIWTTAATIAILAALGAGLWFGGGPTTREGWESASWAAGITTALALVVTAIAWAMASQSSPPPPPPGSDGESPTVNTVNGDISGGIVAQGRDVRVENSSYGGNHNDFRDSAFNGPFVNEQHHHRSAADETTEPNR